MRQTMPIPKKWSSSNRSIIMTKKLALVGCGIRVISQLTTEAIAAIRDAQCVLYLVNNHYMQQWVHESNANAISLDAVYFSCQKRSDSYKAVQRFILDQYRCYETVCVVLYGHPTVFTQPALMAANAVKKEGGDVVVLPGVSAEDCLFADLLINPAQSGCQSYEATDFLIRQPVFEITSSLVLWQVGMIGMLDYDVQFDVMPGVCALKTFLCAHYSLSQPVIVYEAAQFAHVAPTIQQLVLADLDQASFTQLSTLYIQPQGRKQVSTSMLSELAIEEADLYW